MSIADRHLYDHMNLNKNPQDNHFPEGFVLASVAAFLDVYLLREVSLVPLILRQ